MEHRAFFICMCTLASNQKMFLLSLRGELSSRKMALVRSKVGIAVKANVLTSLSVQATVEGRSGRRGEGQSVQAQTVAEKITNVLNN